MTRQEPIRILGGATDADSAYMRYVYAHNESNGSCLIVTNGPIDAKWIACAASDYVGQEVYAFAVRALNTQTNQ